MKHTVREGCVEIVPLRSLQKTVREPVRIAGYGLHMGGPSEMVIEPAPTDYGVRFSLNAHRPHVMGMFSYCEDNTTSLISGDGRFQTVEHVLSALSGLGVDNAHVRLDSFECPTGDGSAQFIVQALLGAGIQELPRPARALRIVKPITFQDETEGRMIIASPWNTFLVEAEIRFPGTVIGTQRYGIEVTPLSYRAQIAAARTFIRDPVDRIPLTQVRETRLLGLPASDVGHSPVIIYSTGAYLTPLRFSNEPVRHKILDFIGDLATLGLPVIGRFFLVKPGHKFTLRFCQFLSRFIPQGGAQWLS